MRSPRIEFEELGRTRVVSGPYTTEPVCCRVWYEGGELPDPVRVTLSPRVVEDLNGLARCPGQNAEAWWQFEVRRDREDVPLRALCQKPRRWPAPQRAVCRRSATH